MAYRKLGRASDQRKAILRNMVSELLWNNSIETTYTRALEVRREAEKLLTAAINSYEDTVTVTKQVREVKLVKGKAQKGEKLV